MPIPPEIDEVVQRLNDEFNEINRMADGALELVQRLLDSFPNNSFLIREASLAGNALIAVDVQRRRVQAIISRIEPADIPLSAVQEAGQDLEEILGQVIEVRVIAEQVKQELEDLL